MLEAWVENAVGIVWNYPVVGLCLLTGLFFSLRMMFVQFRFFFHSFQLISGKYDHPDDPGHITHFQALSAALSGTIGLGNIAGVAIAIAMGGPGAIFWMWIVAFFGAATKFAECTLGLHYRDVHEDTGQCRGGPMYYIEKGLSPRWHWLATFFAIFAIGGSLGSANMFQANQVSLALSKYYAMPDWLTGLLLASVVALTIIGGIKRIGSIAGRIVPIMCFFYMLGATIILLLNIDRLPDAIYLIIQDAFTGQAAAGGAVGAVIITGVRRAIFSNESGLGSASIAHAAVKTRYAVREGIVAALGPFIDTAVVCTGTAMVIILAGNYGTEMYQPLQSTTQSIADNGGFSTARGWEITNESVPMERSELCDFLEGKYVLSYDGSSGPAQALSPSLYAVDTNKKIFKSKSLREGKMPPVDGARFSCWRKGGTLSVQVIDSLGEVIADLPVNKESVEDAFMTLTPCPKEGTWHSHVILFNDTFKERIRQNRDRLSQIRLRFSGEGSDSKWYVDRVQMVTKLQGIELTAASFDKILPRFGSVFVALGVIFFCYSTMITWSYYGETAAAYVFGNKIILPFKWLFVITAFVGCVATPSFVVNLSDLFLGLMVIPNTIAILLLSGVVARLTKEYGQKLKAGEFDREVDELQRKKK
ncbi:MAG: hypothetical protein CMO81_01075 [Waddliaceae bacterium]|nr:hypothetical protein [Waddliaceae bacterium]